MLDNVPTATDAADGHSLPISQTIGMIVFSHHSFLQRLLPRISLLFDRVIESDGRTHPELYDLETAFAGLRSDLEAEMRDDERNQYLRLARSMDAAARDDVALKSAIRDQVRKQEVVNDALDRIREMSCDFQPIPDASSTHRALMSALKDLESALRLHLNRENVVHYPRVAALSRRNQDSRQYNNAMAELHEKG